VKWAKKIKLCIYCVQSKGTVAGLMRIGVFILSSFILFLLALEKLTVCNILREKMVLLLTCGTDGKVQCFGCV
jgi:hypothetical protein